MFLKLSLLSVLVLFSCGSAEVRQLKQISGDLQAVWDLSGYGTENEREQGGAIVKDETTGRLKFIHFERQDDVATVLNGSGRWLRQLRREYEILYVVHTHPFKKGFTFITGAYHPKVSPYPSRNDYEILRGDERGLILSYKYLVIHDKKKSKRFRRR